MKSGKPMKVALVSFDFGEYCIRLASGIAQDPDTKVLLFLPDYESEPYLHLLSKSVELRAFKNVPDCGTHLGNFKW